MSKKFLSSSFLRWLTFYLLLVLAILLLIANLFPQTTKGVSGGNGTPTATLAKKQSTVITVTAANTTKTAIATNPVSPGNPPIELHLTQIDAHGLISNTKSATTNVTNQVKGDQRLQGKHAAFVIIYVGLSTPADPTLPSNAPRQVASRIETILQQLDANNKFGVFTNAVYQSVVFVGKVTNDNQTINGTSDLSVADLEIYPNTSQQS